MMMPIVSMNKMAMNESVATSCCMKQSATPTAAYWTTLYGGYLGTGYVTTLGWKTGYNKDMAVLKLPFDISTNAAGATAVGEIPNVIFDGTDWWGISTTDAMNKIGVAGGYWSKGKACTHADGYCNYRTETIEIASNQHWDSTAKHDTDGGDWKKPHPAQQFNS